VLDHMFDMYRPAVGGFW